MAAEELFQDINQLMSLLYSKASCRSCFTQRKARVSLRPTKPSTIPVPFLSSSPAPQLQPHGSPRSYRNTCQTCCNPRAFERTISLPGLSLPSKICRARSLTSLKNLLTCHLFGEAYPSTLSIPVPPPLSFFPFCHTTSHPLTWYHVLQFCVYFLCPLWLGAPKPGILVHCCSPVPGTVSKSIC